MTGSHLQNQRRTNSQGGFSLVETTLAIGIFSFGLLSVVPILALGLKDARQARDDRTSAEIAQVLMDEAQQGMTWAGPVYFDSGGAFCGVTQAAFTATGLTSLAYLSNPQLSQLTVTVTPIGAPDRQKSYAMVYASNPTP